MKVGVSSGEGCGGVGEEVGMGGTGEGGEGEEGGEEGEGHAFYHWQAERARGREG